MPLSPKQKQAIKSLLVEKIRTKLEKYNPETSAMPFHYRLLGRDRMALYSFIHSVNTILGASIFEKAAEIIIEPKAKIAISQYKRLEGYICDEAVLKIEHIIDELKEAKRKTNKQEETKEILSVATTKNNTNIKKARVDLFAEMNDGTEYYFELKTAKPNIASFIQTKRQLLNWIAMRGSQDPKVKIKTILAIPYNPYEPKPYERWTLQGLFDLKEEVLVGKDFWDFLGGKNCYEDLLKIFEEAGLTLYDEIDKKMRGLK